jgi:hypothetical protein
VVDDLVNVFTFQSVVGSQGVTVEGGASLNMLSDFGLQRSLFPIRNYGSSDFSAALRDSHNCGLVFSARASDAPFPFVGMHVPSQPTYKCLVHFNLPKLLIGWIDAER